MLTGDGCGISPALDAGKSHGGERLAQCYGHLCAMVEQSGYSGGIGA